MQWNYFKIAWRIIQKNLGHTIVNVIGLGLGFLVTMGKLFLLNDVLGSFLYRGQFF